MCLAFVSTGQACHVAWRILGGATRFMSSHPRSLFSALPPRYDGAEPSASSYAASNLYRLAALLAGSTTGSTTSGAGGVAGGGGSTAGGGATATAGSDASEEYRSRADRTLAAFEVRDLRGGLGGGWGGAESGVMSSVTFDP